MSSVEDDDGKIFPKLIIFFPPTFSEFNCLYVTKIIIDFFLFQT